MTGKRLYLQKKDGTLVATQSYKQNNRTMGLNGWYYVVGKSGMPFVQERVDAVVKENFAIILKMGEFVARICDATNYNSKPVLIDPFTAEYEGVVLYRCEEPDIIARVTAFILTQKH